MRAAVTLGCLMLFAGVASADEAELAESHELPVPTVTVPENPCDWMPLADVEAILGPVAEPPRREYGCRYVLKIPEEVAARRQQFIKLHEQLKALGGEEVEDLEAGGPMANSPTDPTSYSVTISIDPKGGTLLERSFGMADRLTSSAAGSVASGTADGGTASVERQEMGEAPTAVKQEDRAEDGWDSARSTFYGFAGRVGHLFINVEGQAPDLPIDPMKKLAAALRDRIPDLPFAASVQSHSGEPDPCAMVSREAAENILGALVVSPYRSADASPLVDPFGPSCSYYTPRHHVLVLTPTLTGGKEAYALARGVGALVGAMMGEQAKRIEGPWDHAIIDTASRALLVLKGDMLLQIDFLMSNIDQDEAQKFARLALGVGEVAAPSQEGSSHGSQSVSKETAAGYGAGGSQGSSEETTAGERAGASASGSPAQGESAPQGTADGNIEGEIQSSLMEAFGAVKLPHVPPELQVEGTCRQPQPDAANDVKQNAKALIPLKPGLTLSGPWHTTSVSRGSLTGSTSDGDLECLTQIREVGENGLATSVSCSTRPGGPPVTYERRTCRSDMRTASVYMTEAGSHSPVTLVGATSNGLSQLSFNELKSTGTTQHRYVEIVGARLEVNVEGEIKRVGMGTFTVIVNDRPVDLPVIRVSGTLRGTCEDGQPCVEQMQAAILDDARFPLVLDYKFDTGFRIAWTKISFPTEGELEKHLLEEKRIDIYGIYFDFASDRIRPESEPVLNEIADVLMRNPSWTLQVNGHTDGIGSDASNLELSNRRSEAVRAALIARGIASERLTTSGFGESQPVETNDTLEGRARNRRVELVRQ